MPRQKSLRSAAIRTTRKRKNYALFITLGLTLLLRILFILEVRHLPFATVSPQIVDAWAYHRWALEILKGNFWGSEVFFLRPLYPYLLALLYALFGPKVIVAQLFQALLATISCFLLFRITEKLFNATTALFAGLGFALSGVLIFYTGTLLYVELTIFFTLLTMDLILNAGNRWWRWLLAGISFGLLVISRPEFLILLPLLLLYLYFKEKASLKNLLPFLLTALATIATIPVRNLIVARDPVIFTAHSGINFYYGNNPAADGTWQPSSALTPQLGFSHQQLKRTAKIINGVELSWSEASNYWLRQGLKFIITQPGNWVKLLLRKFILFWSNYEIPNNYYFETVRPFSRILTIAFLNFGITAALAILGIIFTWRHRRNTLAVPALPAPLFLLYLFIAGHIASALSFYVLSRLRAPVIPPLLIFAAAGITGIIKMLKNRQLLRTALALLVVIIIYIATNIIPINRQSYAAQAWTQAGNIYLEKKQLQPAIDALNRALTIDPKNIFARYTLILTYAGMRRLQDAEREFTILLQTAGTQPEARTIINLARARLAIAYREFPLAAEYYHQVLTTDPTNPETYYLLGLVHISLNNPDSARVYLQAALDLDPEHDAARDALNALARYRQ